MIRNVKINLLFAFSITTCFTCFAHGDLSERIRNISKDIITYPDSVQLYHQRGVLYTQHGNFKLAVIDLAYCQKFNYQHPAFKMDMATALYHHKKYDEALTAVEEILCTDAGDSAAFRLQGKILFETKKYTEAAVCFEKVIEYSQQPKPEFYIEASGAWQLSNHINAHCFAQEIIEKGILHLNGLIVLQKELIQLHLKNDDLADAIAIQTHLLNYLNRKEHAYYQLALMKREANMMDSAKEDLQLARKAIQQLPARLLSTQAIQQLTNNINKILIQK